MTANLLFFMHAHVSLTVKLHPYPLNSKQLSSCKIRTQITTSTRASSNVSVSCPVDIRKVTPIPTNTQVFLKMKKIKDEWLKSKLFPSPPKENTLCVINLKNRQHCYNECQGPNTGLGGSTSIMCAPEGEVFAIR